MEDDLIAGIVQDASKEAERVLAEAKKAVAERIKAAQDQGRAVIQQAESKVEEQAARIRTQSASSMRMERRRISLKLREQAVQEVLTRVRQASGDPMVPQGVVVKAAGGRVEFNNQVATRLQRLQSEIRKQIQDILWKNESSDR